MSFKYLITILLSLALAANCGWSPTGNSLYDFQSFKSHFKRKYESLNDELERYGTLSSNINYVNDFNKKEASESSPENSLFNRSTFALGLNEYSDMKHEEFILSLLGFKSELRQDLRPSSIFRLNPTLKIPDSVDYRQLGYVTKVKNQGTCASCWAFAATGALEALNFKLTRQLIALSEQQIMDCSKEFGNFGCVGGIIRTAFNYVRANQGITSEDRYPYQAKSNLIANMCPFNRTQLRTNATSSDTYLPNLSEPVEIASGDELALAQALFLNGPISIAVDASPKTFQFYKSGIYSDAECNSNRLNHAVLLVGYDEESFIIKNSWGETWGENGFMRVARNRGNLCGVASAASYPLSL